MTKKAFLVFVVEDDPWYSKLLVNTLSRHPDLEIDSFGTGAELLDNLYRNPAVITLDYRLPDTEGMSLLGKIKARNPATEVLVISEQDSVDTAVTLLREGAYDYLTKDSNLPERLTHALGRIRQRINLEDTIADLRTEVREKFAFEKSLIGESAALRKLFPLLEKAASSDINVVITGETGTGKEMVAKAVHYGSERTEGPFIPVNMAAIPENLVESELFGYEKGAFTGANSRKIGFLEAANGGTLFLDEIGETDIAFQPKLLRALQEREIQRVGGTELIPLDIRLVVATNRDFAEEIKAGNFRQDLYYRLIGIKVNLPPLRERGDDVLLLAKHFVHLYCEQRDMPEPRFSPEAIKMLNGHSWPGNVRELRAVIELAVVMATEGRITAEDLQLAEGDLLTSVVATERSLKDYTEAIIRHYLTKYDGKVKTVADKLDIHPSTIYRLLKADGADASEVSSE